MQRILSASKHADWWLLVPTAYLLALGFVIQYSILFKTKGVNLEYGLDAHLIAILLAVLVAFFASYFSPIKWQRFFNRLYFVGLVLLGLVLVAGEGDVTRWLNLGGLRFQPTELTKLALIGASAAYMASKHKTFSYGTTLVCLLISAVPAALIALQPSLSSALVLLFVGVMMLMFANIKTGRFLILALVSLVLIMFMLPLLKPYQTSRIESFLNPAQDGQGASYNSIQAGIAIGSGGLLGRGLDSGSQSQLNFLPAQHTDFAFAVTAEKLGLIGALSIILALTILLLRLCYLAKITDVVYWRLMLVGIAAMLFCHSLINIGMNVGLLPVTGLPLPFISYGGTFLFACLTSVLLAVILSYHIKQELDNSNQALQE